MPAIKGEIEIRFWGVRGSMPVCSPDVVGYGGCTPCVEIIADNGTHIVLDAGTGIQALGMHYLKIFNFIRSADVLIHDAQYTPMEYSAKIGWGHCSFTTAVRAAIYGQVKHLVLFHHDPLRTDAQIREMLQSCAAMVRASGAALTVSAASQTASPLQL